MRKVRQRAEMAVCFTTRGRKAAFDLKKRYPQLTLFIREVLAQDPRPAYRKGERNGQNLCRLAA